MNKKAIESIKRLFDNMDYYQSVFMGFVFVSGVIVGCYIKG